MNEYVKNLKRIEFVVTMACTGKCKHCSEGEHINCKGHIDTEIAVKSIREICGKYKIESLMTIRNLMKRGYVESAHPLLDSERYYTRL